MLGVDSKTRFFMEPIMVHRAFPAEVTNGQLRFQESLADLEGRRVLVVLDEYESPSKPWPRLTPDPLSLDELDIEHDVSFRMPFQWEPIKATVVDGGPLRPSLIVPEEISDE